MIYAVYYERIDGGIGLVDILKNKREALRFIPTTGYFLKAYKHLTKAQVENLFYAQAVLFESILEENNEKFWSDYFG